MPGVHQRHKAAEETPFTERICAADAGFARQCFGSR